MSRIIGPVQESLRRMVEPWRVAAVLDDNDMFIRSISDPWLRFQFVNEVTNHKTVFDVVALEEADQLPEVQAREKLARFAASSLKDAFLLVPPEGLDFDEAYKATVVIEGYVINSNITPLG